MKTSFDKTAATAIPLHDEALPVGWGPWDLPSGWQCEPDSGPGGSPAMRLTRTDSTEYLNARLPVSLTEGERYRLTAAIAVEHHPEAKPSGHAGIEFFDSENRYLGGSYLPPVLTPCGWVNGEAEFTVPRYTAECRLMFYIRAGVTGTARFSKPVIEPAPFRWTAYPLTPVRDELPAGGGEVPFGFFSQGGGNATAGGRCRVEVLEGALCLATAEAPIRDDRFTVSFGRLPAGSATLRFTLVDGCGGVRGERLFPVTIVDDATEWERAANGCVIDTCGRTRIRNRPFLPIGLYMGMIERHELADLAGTAFNCLMPYGSCELRFSDTTKQGVEAAREVLDACGERGIKIIFSLAGAYDECAAAPVCGLGVKTGVEVTKTAIREFSRHPALLAWYINDEQPVERIPHLLERRRLIRSLDPLHPIYAVMCQVPELPLYSELVDVYGIDPYPIVDPACNHIRISRYAHDMAGKAVRTGRGMALWTVVQAHNIGAYDPKACRDPVYYREAFRDPSFDEILALALLAALRGAKGFLFYSYPDLAHPAFDAGSRERRWENVRRVAQALRDLEPFLLSDAEAPDVGLRVIEGEVEARGFRDEAGRTCVLLVGIGPGPCRAEVTVPGAGGLASQFRRTGKAGDWCYRFEGRDVCADMLCGPDKGNPGHAQGNHGQ